MSEYRIGYVYVQEILAGELRENESGYELEYNKDYVEQRLPAVSLTLPLREVPYRSPILFPFFDGLIPEGWLLEVAINSWKLNRQDRFGILLVTCADCIGDVSVRNEVLA